MKLLNTVYTKKLRFSLINIVFIIIFLIFLTLWGRINLEVLNLSKQIIEKYKISGLHYEFSAASTTPVYHYHNHHEIYIMHSGENMYFVKDRTYHLKTNDMIFIDKNVIHKPGYITGTYSRIFLYVNEDFLDDKILSALKKLCHNCVYTPENSEYIKRLIDKLKEEMKTPDNISETLTKCYLSELIAYCLRNKSLYTENNLHNPIIERLVKHINECYSENITLRGSAEHLHMSESYLSRLFKNITGFSFKEYLTAIRIKRAKELLTTTQKNVKQIALECGFNDSNYFSKNFKDESGLSPLNYKKLFKHD